MLLEVFSPSDPAHPSSLLSLTPPSPFLPLLLPWPACIYFSEATKLPPSHAFVQAVPLPRILVIPLPSQCPHCWCLFVLVHDVDSSRKPLLIAPGWTNGPREPTLACLYIHLTSVLPVLSGMEESVVTWRMHTFSGTKKGTRACFCQDMGAGGVWQTWQEEEMAGMAGRLVILSHSSGQSVNALRTMTGFSLLQKAFTSIERWDG